MYIKYDDVILSYLSSKDPLLGNYIKEKGYIKRKREDDLYKSLIFSIIGQQISTKVADNIRDRLSNDIDITPINISKLSLDDLREYSIGKRKASFIKSITEHFLLNEDFEDKVKELSDEDVIKELTKLKGVGIWTAEMLLIHTLNRMNVLTFKDLAIKRGLMRLHNLDELTKEDELYYKQLYSPYGTVVSIYLWELSK